MRALRYWWRAPVAQKIIGAYQRLSVREQRLAVFTLNVVLAVAVIFLLLWPAFNAFSQVYAQASDDKQRNAGLQQKLTDLQNKVVIDPNEPVRIEQAQVDAKQALLDERIALLTRALIPPAEMTSLLGKVLEQNRQLKPTSLETLPAEKVDLGEGFTDVDLYRHRLRLTMKATYPALVSYLQQLDQSPWTIGWESLEYEVQKYPYANLTIEVSALSRQPEVLGGY